MPSLTHRRSPRPEHPRVRGHRFSRDRGSGDIEDEAEEILSNPHSPRSSKSNPTPSDFDLNGLVPPPEGAPSVYLLDPGSGEACPALQWARCAHVHLAVDADFDQPVKRYPPHWKSMAGVKLTEGEANEDAAAHARVLASASRSAWPSTSDLRGPAHPRNLATWASTFYTSGQLSSVDCSATGCTRQEARGSRVARTLRPTADFICLVCGSRGGEVTLPHTRPLAPLPLPSSYLPLIPPLVTRGR